MTKFLCNWILITLMVIAVHGHADGTSGSNVSHLEQQSAFKDAVRAAALLSPHQYLSDIASNEEAYQGFSTASSTASLSASSNANNNNKIILSKYAVFAADTDSHDHVWDSVTFNNLSALRDPVQSRIIYLLIAEFNPPDLSFRSATDFRFPKKILPWFVASKPKTEARISGWKDGNSQYRARLTYS